MAVETIDCIIRKWFVELWASFGSPKASGKVNIELTHTHAHVFIALSVSITTSNPSIDFCDFHNAWFLIELYYHTIPYGVGKINDGQYKDRTSLTYLSIKLSEWIWGKHFGLIAYTYCTLLNAHEIDDSIRFFSPIFFAFNSNFIGSIWCRHLVPM